MEEWYVKFVKKQRLNKLPKFWVDMELAWFKRWREEDVLGIVLIPDPDDPEGELIMSEEDTIALGKATKKRKEVRNHYLTGDSRLTLELEATALLVQ